jgi:hypothetical protein
VLASFLAGITLTAVALGWTFQIRSYVTQSAEDKYRATIAFTAGNAAGAAWAVVTGNTLWTVISGLGAVICAWDWWRRRKRRDPAARQFGAKSRLLVAALVERAREAAQPRRVLRPVPGGAHVG